MANTFLGHEYVTPIEIISENPAFVSDTLNLRRQIVSQGHQRWRFRITFWEAQGSSLMADFMADYMKNREGTVNLNVPQNPAIEDDIASSADVTSTGDSDAGKDNIAVSSTANFTIPTGTFIKFSNHDKVYLVVDGITNATSGTLEIAPALTNDITDTTTVVHDGVQAKMSYDLSQTASFSYTRGNQQRITVDFVEDLS